MKILISCGECLNSSLNPEEEDFSSYYSYESINDAGLYQITCPLGHTSYTSVQEQKFELLFDLGFYAIADGYYREAVTSFTSALERFYEFYISVISIKYDIPIAEFEKSWNLMSNQSERQLGAFIILYLLESKISPILLSNSNTKFRNEVIHKGRVPTQKEAISYGKSISEVIFPILKELKEKHHKFILESVGRYVDKTREKHPDISILWKSSVMTMPTFISCLRQNNNTTFEKYLMKIEKHVEEI